MPKEYKISGKLDGRNRLAVEQAKSPS